VNKRLLLTGVLLAFSAQQASAADWTILNGSTMHCVSALALAGGARNPAISSPFALEKALRATGGFRDTTVMRSKNGDIFSVFIAGAHDLGVLYFPTRELCAKVREHGLADGLLTDPNDLK
jgi:hypothetical protein